MTTVADRLAQLSGMAGVSAATMILAVSTLPITGTTAEALFISAFDLKNGSASDIIQSTPKTSDSEYSMGCGNHSYPATSIKALANTTESEAAVAHITTVVLTSAYTSESSSTKASATIRVDKTRVAQLDDELLWL